MKDYTIDRGPERLEPFFPNEMFRHTIVSCFLVILELIAVSIFPLPFKIINKPDNITWFLLPFYKLGKLVHSEFLFILILTLCALLFISWPFLVRDRKNRILPIKNVEGYYGYHILQFSGHRNLWQRPIQFAIVILTISFLVQLCFVKL